LITNFSGSSNEKNLKLMCVLVHPDDESLGMGGTLARYAAEGIETYLVTATRGERGWRGEEKDYPGLEALGRIRETELGCAAQALGIREVNLLSYVDGDLDQASGEGVIDEITDHLRRVKPDVVVTFGPEGAYGHPDHIAISQFATAAFVKAGFSLSDSEKNSNSYPPHRVSKLYYIAWTRSKWSAYESVFGNLVIDIDGTERHAEPWPDWAITTVLSTESYWPIVWQAVSGHKSQLVAYSKLQNVSDEHHRGLWGTQEFYRALSLVNSGRKREADLFEGLK
jgi:LmbE family N-acetylglucosaminyl deacetylase